ncbi:hypothetical protein BDV27DRAFT_120271 [Aspergillus caelatus]|uniref:Uncharacterized protein n=1 Tax=Aspergillus caelatus TaxID=61420 RepID=A0A5N7AIY8_9EURO|nr:uncharacterized protein BDV27DRAFT_120271 [Aspergillus caelatus]KAE8369851.1 hypothetical protein BDV27DRAFT_120271 [Aspergillus caelatus]
MDTSYGTHLLVDLVLTVEIPRREIMVAVGGIHASKLFIDRKSSLLMMRIPSWLLVVAPRVFFPAMRHLQVRMRVGLKAAEECIRSVFPAIVFFKNKNIAVLPSRIVDWTRYIFLSPCADMYTGLSPTSRM